MNVISRRGMNPLASLEHLAGYFNARQMAWDAYRVFSVPEYDRSISTSGNKNRVPAIPAKRDSCYTRNPRTRGRPMHMIHTLSHTDAIRITIVLARRGVSVR
ncbi:MAG: hypothetical protein H6672_23035 [Anaerolineaceae bacterium]|nr:hypothetical protein [Anaerolineaceae bacterium]